MFGPTPLLTERINPKVRRALDATALTCGLKLNLLSRVTPRSLAVACCLMVIPPKVSGGGLQCGLRRDMVMQADFSTFSVMLLFSLQVRMLFRSCCSNPQSSDERIGSMNGLSA